MRKLGEQWVEELDGKMHMLKAVQSEHFCSGCAFSCTTFCRDPLMSERDIDCSQMIIIKDLGILNEDGCLPNCWGEYPRVEGVVDSDIKTKRYRCVTRCGIYCATELYRTEQQAVDAWNRRA